MAPAQHLSEVGAALRHHRIMQMRAEAKNNGKNKSSAFTQWIWFLGYGIGVQQRKQFEEAICPSIDPEQP